MSYTSLLNYISQHITLSSREIEILKSMTRIKKLRKHQFIVEQGEMAHFENYVVKGCLRCYHIDENGTEHIVQFAIEGWWISDLHSFLTQSTAHFNVDAIEPSEVIQIEYSSLQELYERVPKFERFFRLIIQRAFVAAQERIIDSYSKDARRRYIEFSAKYPEIERRVPQYMLASYLGITPEFLSKIRRRLARRD